MSRAQDTVPRGAAVLAVLVHRALLAITCVLRALPSRWVLAAADRVADLWYLGGGRARRVGLQNLRVAFGDGQDEDARRRILRGSLRESVRSLFLLLHASPLTRARLERWVDVDPAIEREFRDASDGGRRGGVVVSGHVGNWELLLGLCDYFPGLPAARFLVEGLTVPGLDRFVNDLRGTGGGGAVLREGGARALSSHVARGGAAAILVDRNVRRVHGGVWAPFLGLPARTTPLPAWLALRHDVPIRSVWCLPQGDGRYRIVLGEDPLRGVDTRDRDAAILEVTRRINAELDRIVRRHPEAWNWTLKRFKSRPRIALDGYPAYSLHDPDPVPAGVSGR